jgi:hypothetical protein
MENLSVVRQHALDYIRVNKLLFLSGFCFYINESNLTETCVSLHVHKKFLDTVSSRFNYPGD